MPGVGGGQPVPVPACGTDARQPAGTAAGRPARNWLAIAPGRALDRHAPQELAHRLLEVQESERQRLSRELHDDIGQLLTAAKLQADWLQRRMPADLQEHCATLRSTLDDTLANVRDVSAILNPRQLASLGLEASLRAHLLRTLENTDVHWSLECRQRLGGIPEDMAIAAFRITQEAVTNILRHARARNLSVRIERTPKAWHYRSATTARASRLLRPPARRASAAWPA